MKIKKKEEGRLSSFPLEEFRLKVPEEKVTLKELVLRFIRESEPRHGT